MFLHSINIVSIKRLSSSRWLPVTLLLVLTLWLNAHFLRAVYENGTILLETGEFDYDRLINMSGAKAAQVWGINFFDPINRIEPVFYQFTGWWVLGFLARISGLQPWAVANLIHLFFVPAFFLVFWRLAGTVTRSRSAVIAGIIILFLFGNLEWFYSHEYLKTYGKHAVMLPFLQQIFGPYIDSYGMLFGYGALLAWLGILQAGSPRWKQILIFWLVAAVSFNLHFLPAMFFIVAIMLLQFGQTLSALSSRQRTRLGVMLTGVAAAYLAALRYWSMRPPMAIIGLTAGLVWALFFWNEQKRIRYLLPLVPLVTLALLVGANLYSFKSYYGNLLNDYNEKVRQVSLAIPLHVLLVCYAPVVVLTLVSLFREEDVCWRRFKWSLVIAAVMLICNDLLGYNNHPYRFVPYTYPLWAMLAGDGLARLLHRLRNPVNVFILVLSGVALCLGIWSNLEHHSGYAVTGNCRPVDPLVLEFAKILEEVRTGDPSAIFYVEPVFFDASSLAPYTGARFFYASSINFRGVYRGYSTAVEILQAVQRGSLHIDFLITPSLLDGVKPLREMTWGVNTFRIYRLPG